MKENQTVIEKFLIKYTSLIDLDELSLPLALKSISEKKELVKHLTRKWTDVDGASISRLDHFIYRLFEPKTNYGVDIKNRKKSKTYVARKTQMSFLVKEKLILPITGNKKYASLLPLAPVLETSWQKYLENPYGRLMLLRPSSKIKKTVEICKKMIKEINDEDLLIDIIVQLAFLGINLPETISAFMEAELLRNTQEKLTKKEWKDRLQKWCLKFEFEDKTNELWKKEKLGEFVELTLKLADWSWTSLKMQTKWDNGK